MDSNENSEEKTLEATSEMEVEEPNVQGESVKQSEDTNVQKVVAEENTIDESKDSTSAKADDTENTTTESEKLDDEKINTPQNELNVTEEEKKDNEQPFDVSKVAKEADNVQVDTPNPTVTPVAPKEGKRKRKSTNPSPETSVAPPLPQQPAVVAAAEEQNGSSASKRKKVDRKCDKYCWRCHKESVETQCSACPRSWHRRCMGGAPPLSVNNWICGECVSILQAENAESRSPVMADLTVDQLCMMLRHIVERMRDQHGSEPFWRAVDLDDVPNYLDYVVKPMDLSLLESNIRAKLYGSTDAFMADAKWIQHNCIVFNTYTSKLTNTAKQMLKIARQEVSEIETCPDCFARGRNLPRPLPSWFIEPCRRPHPIVWAKLKGFPFWPAKAMSRLNAQGLVDVRFFGEHDRAWVSPKDIYLYSQEPPAMLPKKKKLEMEQCVAEVEEHIQKLKRVVGEFRYSSPKVSYDPHDPMQIKVLLPNYNPSENIKNETKKTDTNNKQQTPVQSTVNNKVTLPKTDKKPQISKNTVVTSTNGIVETPVVEKRKLDRKRKSVDLAKEAVNKVALEAPSDIIINNKSKSKSPSDAPVLTSKSVSDNKSSTSNSESTKNNKSPDVTVIEVTNDITPKRIITAVRKLKNDTVKKIKLMKSHDKEEIKNTITTPKSTNGNQTSLIKFYRPVNNLQNSSDAANNVNPNKTSKTIYIQSKAQMAASAAKIVAKTALADHKVAKRSVLKTANKESPRIIINSSQKNSKDGTLNNKPMTAIPIPARKDQAKAMFLQMNSSASESAKHFNEKDVRLNLTMPTIKQEPKDDMVQPKLMITRRPGKARKSLPNKPPAFPQVAAPTTSRPLPKSISSTSDAMTYIPPLNSEARASISELPPPEAGPISARIHEGSKELANRMAELIVETIKSTAENSDLSSGSTISNHEATINMLKLRIERLKWEHQQEIAELRHNNDLVMREMKSSMDFERFRALQEAKREAELERQRCIEETKRKQWCVVCGREAMFYCCWNTAYCDYPCQQKHWSSHIATCAQKSQKSSNSNTSASQQQQQSKLVSETTTNGQQNGNISDEIQTLSTDSV